VLLNEIEDDVSGISTCLWAIQKPYLVDANSMKFQKVPRRHLASGGKVGTKWWHVLPHGEKPSAGGGVVGCAVLQRWGPGIRRTMLKRCFTTKTARGNSLSKGR